VAATCRVSSSRWRTTCTQAALSAAAAAEPALRAAAAASMPAQRIRLGTRVLAAAQKQHSHSTIRVIVVFSAQGTSGSCHCGGHHCSCGDRGSR
jgi:hypothetical protein